MSKEIIVWLSINEDQLLKVTEDYQEEKLDFHDALRSELEWMGEYGIQMNDWVSTDQKTANRIMKWLRGEIGKLR